MKNLRKQIIFTVIFSFVFIQITPQISFAQDSKLTPQTINFERIIIKVPGIKSEEVFLEYKKLLLELKGVSILGRMLKN
jgi:hypothetical protein